LATATGNHDGLSGESTLTLSHLLASRPAGKQHWHWQGPLDSNVLALSLPLSLSTPIDSKFSNLPRSGSSMVTGTVAAVFPITMVLRHQSLRDTPSWGHGLARRRGQPLAT
jgi:hypothetical protein